MANAVVNKILDFLGVDNGEEAEDEEMLENEYPYAYDSSDVEEPEDEEKGIFKLRKNSKVVNMPQQQIKMKIAKPTAFEQAEDICILLREKNAIVVNLEYVNKDVARRILDVISGAVKVLDGHFEKVSNSIFIVAPFNYDIVNDMTREEIKNKLSVSWLK
ncbi:MAG: cell division protein SepF [Clostridia bacterium]|nr:cell division protein SepF [Clostridia bacterium]